MKLGKKLMKSIQTHVTKFVIRRVQCIIHLKGIRLKLAIIAVFEMFVLGY